MAKARKQFRQIVSGGPQYNVFCQSFSFLRWKFHHLFYTLCRDNSVSMWPWGYTLVSYVTINTCYITALYNFPLWLASHPVGQCQPSFLFLADAPCATLATYFQCTHVCVLFAWLGDLAISRPTMADTCFQGGTKPSDRILSNFISGFNTGLLGDVVISWLWGFYIVFRD